MEDGIDTHTAVGSAKNVAHDSKCLLAVGMPPHVAIL